ncbi:Response regulator protein CarR [Gammaproteobacteria bacterium]
MKILLAEDDQQLGERLRDDLIGRGYVVDLADNGIDADHLGTEESYDCIILDLGLPQRPGLEVLKRWRARGKTVPVLILTGRGAWHEKVEGLRSGADDYLVKPFNFEELLARLQALIRRSHGRLEPVLSQNGLTLDEDRQMAFLDGAQIPLSGVEFRLLRYMMLHPDKILSKTELTDHVYDSHSEKESNVIEVYVNRLRNKIGSQRIMTRRGQGYVFGKGD